MQAQVSVIFSLEVALVTVIPFDPDIVLVCSVFNKSLVELSPKVTLVAVIPLNTDVVLVCNMDSQVRA